MPDNASVTSKEELLALIARLAADKNPQRWPNHTALEFVEAMGSWLEDANGYYSNTGCTLDTSQPSWHLIADMLQAGRICE